MPLPRLLIIQPQLTTYRIPIFEAVAERFDVAVTHSLIANADGFGDIDEVTRFKIVSAPVSTFNNVLYYQHNILSVIFKTRPDAVFSFANPRFGSFWLSAILARALRIPFYAHGQGIYKKDPAGFTSQLIYRSIAALCTKYVCYNEVAHESMIKIGVPRRSLEIAHNVVINKTPVIPDEKSGNETGVLFVGRLRQGSRVKLLIEAVTQMRNQGLEVDLHIVGDGVELDELRSMSQERPYVKLYGKVYDDAQIAAISRNCFAGCYAGDAGLSVVHMFSLSLPVVVHGKISRHMGPEPGYVSDGFNGGVFAYDDGERGIREKLTALLMDRSHRRRLSENAFETYVRLTAPGMAVEIIDILERRTSA